MAKDQETSERHSEQRENENELERVDRETADEFRKLAKLGNPEAQFLLGHMFRDGRGVECDCMEGASWWWRAAKQGHMGAQRELGNIHRDGDGVRKNAGEAMHWYELAAKRGDVPSQQFLEVLRKEKIEAGRVKNVRLTAKGRQDLIWRLRDKLRTGNLTPGDYAATRSSLHNLVVISRRRARRGEEDLLSELEPEGEA